MSPAYDRPAEAGILPDRVPGVRLILGDRALDVTTRAVVIGLIEVEPGRAEEACLRAAEAVELGAEVVELAGAEPGTVAAVRAASGGALVGVAVAGAGEVRPAVAAGASVVTDRAGLLMPDLLAAVAGTGVAVIGMLGAAAEPALVVERTREAEQAGVAAERVLIDAGLAEAGPGLLARARRLAALGRPLVLSTRAEEPGRLAAEVAAGVIGGCRVIRTGHVRSARRAADALAAVLQAGAG